MQIKEKLLKLLHNKVIKKYGETETTLFMILNKNIVSFYKYLLCISSLSGLFLQNNVQQFYNMHKKFFSYPHVYVASQNSLLHSITLFLRVCLGFCAWIWKWKLHSLCDCILYIQQKRTMRAMNIKGWINNFLNMAASCARWDFSKVSIALLLIFGL